MKFVFALAALVSVCAALPVEPSGSEVGALIVRDIRTNDGIHGYDFDFETSNKISRKETGVLKTIGEEAAIVVDGQVSWISPEGIPVNLKFVADENGYQPVLPIY